MDAWIAGWASGVVPLRQEFGFVWLVGYSGTDGFDAADERYCASPKRGALRPEPSELIEEAREVMVDAVL